jgi:hypothetical protein
MVDDTGLSTARPPRGPRSWVPVATVAVFAAAVLAGSKICGMSSGTTLTEQLAERREAAEHIRVSARQALDQGRYREGLRMLDEAKRFDPQGDLDPAIQDGRREATRALEAGAGDGSLAE